LIVLYATNPEEQHGFIEQATRKGYSVLVMDSVVDLHFLDFLERKLENVAFKRVDADIVDRLIEKEEENVLEKLTKEEKKNLEEWFKSAIADKNITVRIESLKETEDVIKLIQPEFMRRLHDMSKVAGGLLDPSMDKTYTLIVNANHPVITNLVDTVDEEKRKLQIEHLVDLAMLEQGLLKGEKLAKFIQRNFEILK